MTETLQHDDLEIVNGKMRVLRAGTVVVLFGSRSAKSSIQIKKMLERVRITGLLTCWFDINNPVNKSFVQETLRSKTPLSTFPQILVFHNKLLKSRYRGQISVQNIHNYLQGKMLKFSEQQALFGSSDPSKYGYGSTSINSSSSFSAGSSEPSGFGSSSVSSGMVGGNVAWRAEKL